MKGEETMLFRQKLAYIALGGLLVFMGQLLAIITGHVTAEDNENIDNVWENAIAQNEANENLKVTEFEAIRCKSLEIVDHTVKVKGKLWIDGQFGKADFSIMMCEHMRVVDKLEGGPLGGNILALLGYTDSKREDIIRVFNRKATSTRPKLDDSEETVEYPITDDIVRIGANDIGGYVDVSRNRAKDQGKKRGVQISNDESGGLIKVYQTAKNISLPVVSIGATPNGGQVEVYPPLSFTPVALMTVNSDENGLIGTYDKESNAYAAMVVSKKGGLIVASGDNGTAHITINEYGDLCQYLEKETAIVVL